MLRKALILRLFDAAYMQRWNDRLRPVELIELDKQAHKMIMTYFLGKFEEKSEGFSWIEIIEGGIFELLQRVIITDIKPQVFYKIKEDKDKYRQLNDWIYSQLEKFLVPLGHGFADRFRLYFETNDDTINKRILNAAHIFSTRWEFTVIEKMNSWGYDIDRIRHGLDEKLERYSELEGMKQMAMYQSYRNFLDLCGQLRFQYRWSNLHKTPKTSVLGHMLLVAIFSYLLSLEIDASPKRAINNYFTGLFHDLPEVLTRDIISPVKRSVEGLKGLIQEYEKEQMEKEVYRLIPKEWHEDIRMYTENEFDDIIHLGGKRIITTSEEINEKYNSDEFNPRDGRMLKAADELSAFLEAYEALKNGSYAPDFLRVKVLLSNKYDQERIAGINFGQIYADFE